MSTFSFQAGYPENKTALLTTLRRSRIPTAATLFIIITLTGVIMTVLFMVFVPWVQTVSGNGRMIALDPGDREQAISALVPGRIAEWYVREGATVRKGDPIARIIDNDDRLLERLESQLALARDRFRIAESAAQTAENDIERKASLLADGLVSRLEYEQSQIRLAELENARQSAADAVNRAEVAVSREGSQQVTAPRDGVITRVFAGGTATFVSAGDPLARFAPINVARAVELYVDGRDISLVTVGREVRLQFEGWPVVQFSGWPSVAVGTFEGTVLYVDPQVSTGGRFRILIGEKEGAKPWPSASLLRLGTGTRGWVLLDEVSVGYELWRQLNNFPPEFPAELQPTGEGTGVIRSPSSSTSGAR